MADAKKAEPKYGVRVFKVDEDALVIKQTILRGGRYVIDEQRERFVDMDNDSEIARAVRAGVVGRLKAGKG